MSTLHQFQMDPIISAALQEDIGYEDLSTNAIFEDNRIGKVSLIAKEDGIIAGLEVFKRTFTIYDSSVTFEELCQLNDGDKVTKGQVLLNVIGNIQSLLTAERVAINFLQRLSGIATLTAQYISTLDDSNIKLFDTRKTTPNLRCLEKYAVTVGGGYNHRFNLSDGILLKDNHISASGGVTQAITKARQYAPFIKKIEIEVESLEEVSEAAEAKADIIMLDNMSIELIEKAIELIAGRSLIECSGNINMSNINRFKGMKIDYVSSGSLTNAYKSLDYSLKHLTYID